MATQTIPGDLNVVGTLTTGALAAGDMVANISGSAAQTATGAGGAVSATGGTGGATSGVGGASSVVAGAGGGTGAGGVASVTGGGSGAGATGNGGVGKVVGGAALSTNGTGGAAQVTGGVATGTGTGGAATITGGASAGASGTAGAASIDAGAAASGTAGNVLIGDVNAGSTYIGRGAVKPAFFAATLVSLGTAQSSAPTSAQLLGGFLTQTSAVGGGAVTLPTGTALSAACPRTPVAGDRFDCEFANLGGGQTLTITGATGTTVISGGAVATAKSATIKFINTGTNTWSISVVGG